MPEWLSDIVSIILPVLSAIASYIIAVIRTRKAVVEKQLDKVLNDVSSSTLSKYYVTIDNKQYCLSDLIIKKKEV